MYLGGPKPSAKKGDKDYDDEAHKLWESLGFDPKDSQQGRCNYSMLDGLWKHPKTGGTIYVGNECAAKSHDVLKTHGIKYVVNCTGNIPNYHEGKLEYLRFEVANWMSRPIGEHKQVAAFFAPVFDFIRTAVHQGDSVLVHCLAGAHRAGTTGVASLMYFARMSSAQQAIIAAKTMRPVIEPIGMFPRLLGKLEAAITAGALLQYSVQEYEEELAEEQQLQKKK